MSDAPFQSQDSQANWTALGDRMRRNRSWLLLMFVGLGAYMGAQGWARLEREGISLRVLPSDVALTSTPAETDPATPPTEPTTADLPPETAAESEPKAAPPTVIHRETRSDDHRVDGAPARADAPRKPSRPANDTLRVASRQPPRELVGLAQSAATGIAAFQRQREDSRREAWRAAAAALAMYLRRSPRQVPVLVTSPPESSPAPRRIEPSAGPPPQAIVAKEPRTDNGPQLAAPERGLSIHNPNRTGIVRYLVNGQDRTLRPGESQKLPAGHWLIEFHRGGPYGDTAHKLASGSYRFEIGQRGWELVSSEGP